MTRAQSVRRQHRQRISKKSEIVTYKNIIQVTRNRWVSFIRFRALGRKGHNMFKWLVISLFNKLALYFCKGEFFFEVVEKNFFFQMPLFEPIFNFLKILKANMVRNSERVYALYIFFRYCSTPSKIKLSCLGEHYYHKILHILLYYYYYCTEVSHLLPRPTEKIQFLSPHQRYWAEILRMSSNSPNLIFGLVLVNPIGSSN